MTQFDTKYSGLNTIQSSLLQFRRDNIEHFVRDWRSRIFSESVIIGIQSAAITITSQVFRRENEVQPTVPIVPAFFHFAWFQFVIRTNRLSCIFENVEVMFFAISMIASISAHCPKRCTGTIAFVFGVMAASIAFGSIVKVSGIDIHQYRLQFEQKRSPSSGYIGEVSSDHFITRLKIHHSNLQGICTHWHRGSHVLLQGIFQLCLERILLPTINKRCWMHHTQNSLIYFSLYFLILTNKVNHLDFSHSFILKACEGINYLAQSWACTQVENTIEFNYKLLILN